jgi:hypothetical protein
MAGYTPAITRIEINDLYKKNFAAFGGWDPEAKKVKKLQFAKMMKAYTEDMSLCAPAYAMDTIALAVEAGELDEESFNKLLKGADLEALCDGLADYEEWWVNERHFHAMATLMGYFEEQLNTYPNIGEALRENFAG